MKEEGMTDDIGLPEDEVPQGKTAEPEVPEDTANDEPIDDDDNDLTDTPEKQG